MDNMNLNQIQNPNVVPGQQISSPAKKKSPLFLIAVVTILVIGGLLLWYINQTNFEYGSEFQLQRPSNNKGRVEAEINQELTSIDLGNIDAEFQAVDNDLNGL